MAVLRIKDIRKMNLKEINEKIKELKIELVKNQVAASKGGKLKTREIKRTIARLLTVNRLNLVKETSKPKATLSNKVDKKSIKK